MKRLLAILLIFTLAFSIPVGFNTLKTEGKVKTVKVNKKNFPDKIFRKRLKKCKEYKNGKIKTKVDSIKLSGVKNYKGLERFSYINYLSINSSVGKDIIIEGKNKTDIGYLYIKSTKNKTITIKKFKLEEIDGDYNNHVKLVLDNDGFITKEDGFDISGRFNGLKVTNCNTVTTISIIGYKLKNLEVSNCSSLKNIWCGECDLYNISFDNLKKIKSVDCSGNKIKGLDFIRNYKNIKELDVADNKLGNYDYSKFSSLKKLNTS